MGFGVFVTTSPTGTMHDVCPSVLQGVADYEVSDPHAPIQLKATLSDRLRGDFTKDYATVYGPLTLVNAACWPHSCVEFTDEDIGQSGKLVSFTWKSGMQPGKRPIGEICAAYPAPKGQVWHCRCHTLESGRKCQRRCETEAPPQRSRMARTQAVRPQ